MLVFQHGQRPQIESQIQKLPLRVILRSFEKARLAEPQLSIFDYLSRDLLNHVAAERNEIRDALKYLLSHGRAVIAFDGLDEILDTSQRREFVDLVVSFCNQYPLCPTLVTSRLVGYDDASLPEDFEELILERFDDDEVFQYVNKFMKVVANERAANADNHAKQFIRQTATNADDLRRNPLMLGLMCWLFNQRRDVPSNRPEIYRECAILMFERWDPDRGVLVGIPRNFDRLQLFSELASRIYGKPEYAAGVELGWLEKAIREFFEKLYEERSRSIEATRSLIKFIVGRAWVMSEVGDKVFSFTHQTFLEYFFAKHIDDACDTVAEVFGIIGPKILKREWDVVAHLSLQLKTFRNLRRQDMALETLKSLLRQPHSNKEHAALISFAARSLEYLIGTEAVIRNLVEEILVAAMLRVGGGRPSIFEDAAQCLQCAPERFEVVRSAFVKTFSEWICSNNPSHRKVAADVIDEDTGARSKWSLHEPSAKSPFLSREFVLEVKSNCKEYLLRRSSVDEDFAIICWKWYGFVDDNLINKLGVGMYFRNPLPGGIVGVDGFTTAILCASTPYHTSFAEVEKSAATLAIRTFGRIGFTHGPFPRQEFATKFENLPPFNVWKRWLDEFSKRPAELAGVYFTLFVLIESDAKYERSLRERDRDGRSEKNTVRSESVITLFRLAARADVLKRLPYFPEIMRVIDGDAKCLS